MYNLSQINGTDPQIFIKSTSDLLLNGSLEEAFLIFLVFIMIYAFYMSTGKLITSIARTLFIHMILSLIAVTLEFVSGWYFFAGVVLWAISLITVYFMPDT